MKAGIDLCTRLSFNQKHLSSPACLKKQFSLLPVWTRTHAIHSCPRAGLFHPSLCDRRIQNRLSKLLKLALGK